MNSLFFPPPPPAPEPVPTIPNSPATVAEIPLPKDVMRRGREVARELKRFIKSNAGQVVLIEGSKHPRAECWQFVAACYGHSPIVTSTQELLDEADHGIGFLAIAHLRDAGGQIVSGAEAACMREEPDWQTSPAFQLRSMAQTRACAKVTRNVFAYVMVLAGLCPTPAEEMEARRHREQSPKPSSAQKTVTDRQVKAFEEACATNGKTVEQISSYLKDVQHVAQLRELKRGKAFTEAITWARARSATPSQPKAPQSTIGKLLDAAEPLEGAYSL